MPGLLTSSLLFLSGFAPQLSYGQCVEDPERYLAMSFEHFDQGVQPDSNGGRHEWGWREIARREGCYAAVATLMSEWRARNGASLNPYSRSFMAFHEGQFRAGGGDYGGAIPLIEEGARNAFTDDAGRAYVDAILAFLRSDRDALLAARERLLAVPEPLDWPETQRLFKEQAGQDMQWPRNIEATDKLVECFGKPYPVMGEC